MFLNNILNSVLFNVLFISPLRNLKCLFKSISSTFIENTEQIQKDVIKTKFVAEKSKWNKNINNQKFPSKITNIVKTRNQQRGNVGGSKIIRDNYRGGK